MLHLQEDTEPKLKLGCMLKWDYGADQEKGTNKNPEGRNKQKKKDEKCTYTYFFP